MIELLLQAERALAIGMVDQAERLYRQAIAADPRNSIAVVGLARVALEHSDDVEAYRRAQQALQIDPENVAANRLARRLEELHAHHRRMQARSAPVAPTSSPALAPAPRAVAAPVPEPVAAPALEPVPPPETAPESEPVRTPEPAPEPDGGSAVAPTPGPGPTTADPRVVEPPATPRPWTVAEPEIEPPLPARRRSLLDRLLRRRRT